ncbi:MAG: hypothetical protein ABIR67_01955 [Gaiellaceae bacterium]
MRLAAALGLAACFIAAGCGGSSSTQEEPDAPTLEALWRAPGEDVAITRGASDFGTGVFRFTFLVIDGQSRVVTRPTARIWLARSLKSKPFAQTTARAEPIGIAGSEPGEAQEIFVVRLELDEPGTYWLLAEPVGGRRIQAVGNVVVKAKTAAPDLGAPAIPSTTPTLETATLDALTTSATPDRELYRSSVADALAAKTGFVVVFATPKYCTSRICGPVVDVVSEVRRQHAGERIRFIHVEVFEDNDPARGENRWVKEWQLPSEPWVFVVGADGKIRDRFEGAVSVRELGGAVDRLG